jgi:hypothetical protein
MNGVSTQPNGIRNKSNNKRGSRKVNKSDSIIYHCFVYNFFEHKIYDCLHKDVGQAMFREKVMTIAPKKDDVAVNMVLAITTHSQIPGNVVFKEKEPFKKKSLTNWQEKERLQHSFEDY